MKKKYMLEMKCFLPVTVSHVLEAESEGEAKDIFHFLCLNWAGIDQAILPDVIPDAYPNLKDFMENDLNVEPYESDPFAI